MKSYLEIIDKILTQGKVKSDRTGTGTIALFGVEFRHDLSQGFPLVTTKKMSRQSIWIELEGFIQGITDKQWYQKKGCHIWDEWCSPTIVPYGHDAETKRKMREERDLGPIYGFQWRHFGADYQGYDKDYTNKGVDQLENVVKILKKDPTSRRMVVSALNPVDLPAMALDPCHYAFQLQAVKGKLNLRWDQRSVDTMLGLPFNIASYATLCHLLAQEANLEPGELIGHLGDTHIYNNHIEGAKLQLARKPYPLPKLVINDFSSIFDWQHTQCLVEGYKSHEKINFPIAV